MREGNGYPEYLKGIHEENNEGLYPEFIESPVIVKLRKGGKIRMIEAPKKVEPQKLRLVESAQYETRSGNRHPE